MSKEQEMFALIDEFENSSLNARNFCKAKGGVPSTMGGNIIFLRIIR